MEEVRKDLVDYSTRYDEILFRRVVLEFRNSTRIKLQSMWLPQKVTKSKTNFLCTAYYMDSTFGIG